ncbi:MAG TPA: hypothetical protein VN813_11360 [Luteibacter sp.]|nr:hypothetical protein [Luteibacter sp.]
MKYAPYVWAPHIRGTEKFDLSHLDAFAFSHTAAARDTSPGRPQKPSFTVNVNVGFSHHCFTNGKKNPAFNPNDLYHYPTDSRSFCPIRYQQTFDYDLRGFVQGLPSKRCFRTDHHNGFSVVAVLANKQGYYVTYFLVEAASTTQPLEANLLIESAYVKQSLPIVGRGAYQEPFTAALVRILGI